MTLVRPSTFAPIAALLLTMHASGAYQGRGKGKGHERHDTDSSTGISASFDRWDEQRRIIAGYYRGVPTSNLPPGLAKRGGPLPPGLEKQLRRNGTLPPGLAKRVEPLPPELERQLPPLPPDTRRGFIEGRVVVFNTRTSLVLDAFVPF
jgi:hypothetical protein